MPRPLDFSTFSPARAGSGTVAASKPVPGVAHDDHDLAVRVARDDALDLLGRVAFAAVADGVRQRFLQRELDLA